MDDREYRLELRKYRQKWFEVFFGAVTSIMLAIIAFLLQSTLSSREEKLKRGEQTIALKQSLYSELGKELNIIYVYIEDVGDFREYTPPQIVQLKRDSDRIFFANRFLWTQKTEEDYTAFMQATFQTYNGAGLPARIRSLKAQKEAAYQHDQLQWDSKWDEYFTEESDATTPDRYYELEHALMYDMVSDSIRDFPVKGDH